MTALKVYEVKVACRDEFDAPVRLRVNACAADRTDAARCVEGRIEEDGYLSPAIVSIEPIAEQGDYSAGGTLVIGSY